jgi:hypothetical protein
MVDYASRRKEAMQPKAIIAGFVARDDLSRPSGRAPDLLDGLSDDLHQPIHGAATDRSDIFGDNGVNTPTSQFDLLSSIAMKQAPSAAFSDRGHTKRPA